MSPSRLWEFGRCVIELRTNGEVGLRTLPFRISHPVTPTRSALNYTLHLFYVGSTRHRSGRASVLCQERSVEEGTTAIPSTHRVLVSLLFPQLLISVRNLSLKTRRKVRRYERSLSSISVGRKKVGSVVCLFYHGHCLIISFR